MNNLNNLINQGNAKLALEKINQEILENKSNLNLFYLKAKAEFSLNDYKNCVTTITQIIEYNKNDYTIYNLRGLCFYYLGRQNDAIQDFKKTILIKPDFDTPYNFIGSILFNSGRIKNALYYFNECLKVNKKNILARNNIINALTTYNIENEDNNYFKCNNEIKNIKINFDLNKNIEEKILTFYKLSNNIIDKYLGEIVYNDTQLYKRNSIFLNCERHKKVFEEFKAIPDFCFGCFKVQINVQNVIDLIKLYFFFALYEFKEDVTRKCMVELRPNIKGNYKGLIYCKNLKQALSLEIDLKKNLANYLNSTFEILIKKGCTEFSNTYPEYKKFDSKQNEIGNGWNKFEEIIDKKYPELSMKKVSNESLGGFFLKDILVIRNWIYFAKSTSDNTYKKISEEVYSSKFIDNKLSLK